eukprot:TRINITY_DN4724_c0_g1_i1.p1 TRINITY_DN4724_c0_g1~~TRINITY_DN4724_c0_g1_i1.p1  ORF type:complete len:141 (-),score=12.21 TRINITY_DN4724_c0_g1_i1:80-472(-)
MGAKIHLKGRWADQGFKKYSRFEKYPPYMQGGGYLISRSITEYLTRAEQKYRLQRTVSEDVNMGVWLFGLKVERLNWSKMFKVRLPGGNNKRRNISIDICQKDPPQIVVHRTSKEIMFEYFDQLQNCSIL